MNIDRDTRVNLVDALAPPINGTLDCGVLFTYSAETPVVIAVLMALSGTLHNTDASIVGTPAGQLQAILKLADKIRIVTHVGRFRIPRKFDRITALLDSLIFQVQPTNSQGSPRTGSSFHPKLFLLKYTTEDHQPEYRLVVTSRNLTADRSMDIIAVTRLQEHGGRKDAGEKLSTFINAVLSQQPPGRRVLPVLEQLISELKSLDIRPFGHEVEYLYPDSFDLHCQIGGDADTTPMAAQLKNVLKDPEVARTVISPFIDLSTLQYLFPKTAEHWGDYHILSRREELDRLCSTAEGVAFLQSIQCWVPKVIDTTGQAYEGIHAKLIVDSSVHKSQVLLGSANATRRAWEGYNWETMLSLRTNPDFIKHLQADWFGLGLDPKSKTQPLAERYVPELFTLDQKDDPGEAWHTALSYAKLISTVAWTNDVVRTSVMLTFNSVPDDLFTVSIKFRPISLEHDYFPATPSGEQSFSCQYETSTRAFTCFLEVSVYNGAHLICSVIRLLEDVPSALLEERNDYAVRDEVESQGLFRYLEGIIGHPAIGGLGGAGGGAGEGASLLANLPEFVNLESLYVCCLKDLAKAKEVDRVLMSPPERFTSTEAGEKVKLALIPLRVIWREVRTVFLPGVFS